MAYWDFRNLMYSFEQMGILDVLLPFTLIFTIIFAVLQKTMILGKDEKERPRKNFNVIIALAMALGVVIPHVTGRYPQNQDVVVIINNALPNVSLIAVAIVMVLLIIGVFGKRMDIGESKVGGLFAILAILIVAVIFMAAAGIFDRAYMPSWLYFIYDPQFQSLVVALLVFGLIIGWITKSDDTDLKEKDSWIDQFKKTLK